MGRGQLGAGGRVYKETAAQKTLRLRGFWNRQEGCGSGLCGQLARGSR